MVKKAFEFDLITGEILKKLPQKCLVKLTYTYNKISFRLQHIPLLKTAEVIMIPNPEKHFITSMCSTTMLVKLIEKNMYYFK